MDAVTGNACGLNQPLEAVRPGAGTAEENIPVGDVGNPTSQRDQLRHAVSRRSKDRGWSTPWTGQVHHLQALLSGKHIQLTVKQRLGGVALQDDRLTWRVLQSFHQRAQGGDPDSSTGEHHLSLGTGPAA